MDQIERIAVIGAGAMGSALAKGILKAGLIEPECVTLADVDRPRLDKLGQELGVNVTTDNSDAVRGAGVILLALKPWVILEGLASIQDAVAPEQLVISIAAGVKLETIEAGLPAGVPVVRAMPNTPCLIGQGAIGFSRGRNARDQHVQLAATVLGAAGLALEVPEKLMNAVTGLSGSGPAYVYLAIEALSDAGVRVGLPRDIALKLASQTVAGAALMVLEQQEHPAKLRDQVTTPGGTTIAGIDALEKAGFRSALMEAVKAATKRAEELG